MTTRERCTRTEPGADTDACGQAEQGNGAASSGALIVGTWNVLAHTYAVVDRYPDSPVGWSGVGRVERVAEIVAEALDECDVLCLQEVDDTIFETLGDRLCDVHTVFTPHRTRHDGTMLLSRHPLRDREVLTAGTMSATAARLVHPAGVFPVVSGHLQWSEDQAQVSAWLGGFLESITYWAGEDVLLAMDANASPDSPALSLLAGGGWSVTPAVPTARIHGPGWVALDLVAARSSTVRLLRVVGADGVIPSAAWPSDHCLVVAAVSRDADALSYAR